MSDLVVPYSIPTVSVAGGGGSFPVHRIYCVGRNYAEHAREMGADPEREPPFFFSKPADAVVASGTDVAYPPRTANFHHEIELVVALGAGGASVEPGQALDLVFGYAVGNDFTRRDLQALAKGKGQPWDVSKGFDQSAAISQIHPASRIGHLRSGRIWLDVNGERRQHGELDQMIWSVPEIIAELSTLFALRAGDLIFTGTPAGVGPLRRGDKVEGGIDGLDTLVNRIV